MQGLVIVVATGFVVMGISALLRPAAVSGLFGIDAATPDFRNEIRAVYGGFGVAAGVALLITLVVPEHAAGIRYMAATALCGMAAGRMVSWCIEASGPWPQCFGVLELGAGIGLAFAAQTA